MEYVECANCGARIYEGDDCYTNVCGEVFCDDECVKEFYCGSILEYSGIWSDLNSELVWHDDDNGDDDGLTAPPETRI